MATRGSAEAAEAAEAGGRAGGRAGRHGSHQLGLPWVHTPLAAPTAEVPLLAVYESEPFVTL